MEILSTRYPIARKHHACDASYWIIEHLHDGIEFEISDLRKMVKARRNKWMIQPGEKYIKCAIKSGHDFWCFKAIIEMDDICHKYNLYSED